MVTRSRFCLVVLFSMFSSICFGAITASHLTNDITGVRTAQQSMSMGLDENDNLVPVRVTSDGTSVIAPIAGATSVVTLLSTVTETGASESTNVAEYKNKTFHVTSTGVTTGASIAIQTSLDNVSWSTLYTLVVTDNETNEISVVGMQHTYIRANVTSYTDGTYTVTMQTGN